MHHGSCLRTSDHLFLPGARSAFPFHPMPRVRLLALPQSRSVRKCIAMICGQNRRALHLESIVPTDLPCHPMLPLPLQFFIAMIAHAINERMARKMEYMQE
jgi:hypothetical protein